MSAISRASGLGCARSRITATCNSAQGWIWSVGASHIHCFGLKLVVAHEARYAIIDRLGLDRRRGARGLAIVLAHATAGDTNAYLRFFRILHLGAAHAPRSGRHQFLRR